MKRAILAASFGTSHGDALEGGIAPIETALRAAFPGWDVFRAFTSPRIRMALRRRGMDIEGCGPMLARLRAQGYEDVRVVSTHVIAGEEYEKLVREADGTPVSRPLLDAPEDYLAVAALFNARAGAAGCPLLLMGHGTEHIADQSYARLRKLLDPGVFLACVEGAFSLSEILPALKRQETRRLRLMPLMIVAGDHARNDMAGDGPESWKSILTAEGFSVEARLEGMGGMPEIQKMFVAKARRVIEC